MHTCTILILTDLLPLVALAIVFATTNFTNGTENVAAVLGESHFYRQRSKKCNNLFAEWVVALIFTFYVLTFFVDLLPAVRNRHHTGSGAPQVEMGRANGGSHITEGHRPNGQVQLKSEPGYVGKPHPSGVGHRAIAGADAYYENDGYDNGPLPRQANNRPVAALNF